MSFLPSNGEKTRRCRVLPWLHFSAAILVVVTNALFSAVHSPLGQEISAGESPGFAWIRANITPCVGIGLVYLILICWIQLRQMRQSSFGADRWLPFWVCLQVLSIAAIAQIPPGEPGIDHGNKKNILLRAPFHSGGN